MISAEVLESQAGLGARVRLFSKTDEQEIWIREDLLRYVLAADDLPPEPGDETWLYVDGSLRPDGNPMIFWRSDAEGRSDERRRHDQHWFDVVNQEWIDWPTAVERGAAYNGVRRMLLAEDAGDELVLLDKAMHTVWLVGKWRWITTKMDEDEREAAAAAVERYSLLIAPTEHAPVSGLRWWKEPPL